MHRLLICPPDALLPALWRHVQGVYRCECIYFYDYACFIMWSNSYAIFEQVKISSFDLVGSMCSGILARGMKWRFSEEKTYLDRRKMKIVVVISHVCDCSLLEGNNKVYIWNNKTRRCWWHSGYIASRDFHFCGQSSIPAICSCLIIISPQSHVRRVLPVWLYQTKDILYTLDSASNYSTIQKLKPWLQTQDIPMKWEGSYIFYFLNKELKH
jgi:hypothetical protein